MKLLLLLAFVLAVLHPLLILAAVLAACGALSVLIARSADYRPRLFLWRYW